MPDATYYWPHHRDAGIPPPEDFELDFGTRCWRCHVIRCHTGGAGVWLDDAWMCGGCVKLMDGVYRVRRYEVHPALAGWGF